MKNIIKRMRYFPVVAPLVFVVFFFGYLHPSFDMVIYTDNIKGEGSCSAYMSSENEPFAYLYQANAYFGSELKTLSMNELRYDINQISLYLYDIEEADILSYDIAVFGMTVLHHNIDGDKTVFYPVVREAITSTEKSIAHIINENPEEAFEVNFSKSVGIPTWVWIAYFVILSLISIILSIGLSYICDRFSRVIVPIFSATIIMLTMIIGCAICGSLPYVNYTDFLLNWLLLFAVSQIINSLTLPWVGTTVVSIFTLIWYTANYYVIRFRNKPIMPADIKAAGTAREVLGGYNLTPTPTIVLGTIIVILHLVALVIVWSKTKNSEKVSIKRTLIYRGCTILISALLIYFGVNNPAFNRLNDFQWDAKVLEGFHREGIVLTYVKSAISSHVKRPEGYSRETVNSYLKEYQQKQEITASGKQPTRIIMVMNEAFSDLRVVGLDDSIDVMPFIDSLRDNTIQGSLYVSVLGGGTCNTEFEALTGNSMAFLGSGAYPYTENVTGTLFSLASYFSQAGYLTEAFHANEAQNWNRNRVYPNLGFDIFNSIEKYPKLAKEDYVHLYVSDQTDYHFIESEDEAHRDTPRFLFNVTIQNHADYDHFDGVSEAVTLKEHQDLDQRARVYLSLVKISDDAVKQLVETYQNSNEPTMIIFFGDHQPYFGGEAQEQIYNNIYSFLDYFKTKLFVWTNYRTDSIGNLGLSSNYLPWLILERGNFPMPPYVQMLKELYEAYPVITSQGILDAEGNVYDNIAELSNDPLIQKYQYIQYANLFDEIDPAWFSVK